MRSVAAIDSLGCSVPVVVQLGISAVICCCSVAAGNLLWPLAKVCVRSCTCAQALLMSLMVLSLITYFSFESYVSYEIHCSVSLMARDGQRNKIVASSVFRLVELLPI